MEVTSAIQPLTNDQRTQWNGFLDQLNGQPVTADAMNAHAQANPDFSIKPEMIPQIEQEHAAIKTGNSFGNLNADQLNAARAGMSPTFIGQTDLSKSYYPQFKVGSKDFGTNIEGYSAFKSGNAPVPTSEATGGPGKPIDSNALKTKYASNPYLMDQNRYNWGAKLDNEFPLGGGKVRDAISNASTFNKVDPALLYGSAMEEGMSGAVDPKYSDNASEAYVAWQGKNADKADQYPVDGFYHYGLDTFAGQAKALEKKGYLPAGFSDKFTTFKATNEKNEPLVAPAFKTNADAIMAKSAMLRQAQDQLDEHIKSTGIKLTPKQKEFFLLANYNGGEGLMKKMLQSYKDKGYLKNDDFLSTKFKPASYGGVYKNVQARLQSAQQLRDEKML